MTHHPFFVPSNGANGYIFNDRTFQNSAHVFKIDNVQTEQKINGRFIEMDKLKITLFNFDKPTYDLFQSLRISEPTLGDPFFEPITLTNQIKNGIGVFGAYNNSTFELKIR